MGVRIRTVLAFAALGAVMFFFAMASAQELRVRGLEDNEEYMSLLQQERELKQQEDSLSSITADFRQLYRDQLENREAIGNEILDLEGRIFEIRIRKGSVAARLGAIEQEYVIGALTSPSGEERPEAETPPALSDLPRPSERNLVYNALFNDILLEDDYNGLIEAQELEERVSRAIREYAILYGELVAEATLYAEAETAAEAELIYLRYDSLLMACADHSATIDRLWHSIYDNKTYAYNYLLDRLDNRRLLSRFESEAAEARRNIAAARSRSISEATVEYANEKPLLLRYELSIAQAYDMTEAVDSLRMVIAEFDPLRLNFPAIYVEERTFIDYQGLTNSSTPVYNTRNPIPPLHIYPRGTVYRVFITSYLRPQAPSLFRGLNPIGYVVTDTGSYQYYGGAYRTQAEAEEALPMVRRLGFSSPSVVVWVNGEQRFISNDSPIAYRIEITTSRDALGENIRSLAEGKEISRVLSPEGGYIFTIGTFSSMEEAERLAYTIRLEDTDLAVEVIE